METGRSPIVSLERVSKVYRGDDVETTALNDVSLAIYPGEFVAVTGPSGCGKSTLMNVLGLLDHADDGTVTLMGVAVNARGDAGLTRARRGVVGFIFQNFNLIDEISVQTNVEMPMTYLSIPPTERRRRAAKALDDVGLSHRARHRPSQLSGGQQQRAAIARALAMESRLILADEPTGNLDTANSDAVMAMLLDMKRRGVAIVMVTHAPDLAAQADRQIVMRDGRVIETRAQAS